MAMVQCLCLQTTDWHQVTVKELPEQHDGGSCGVFACLYAKHLLAGSNPAQAFSQNDIPRLRLQMAADLLKACGISNTDLPADSSGMHLPLIEQMRQSQQAFVRCPSTQGRELTAWCHPCGSGHPKLNRIWCTGSCRGVASLDCWCYVWCRPLIIGEFSRQIVQIEPLSNRNYTDFD